MLERCCEIQKTELVGIETIVMTTAMVISFNPQSTEKFRLK
jgi:hypothetical protein